MVEITDDMIVDAYIENHHNAAAAARKLGIGERRAQRAIRRAARRGVFSKRPPAPGFEITHQSETVDGDGWLKSRSTRMIPEREDVEEPPEGMALRAMSVLEDDAGRGVLTWRKYSLEDRRRLETVEAIREAFADLPQAIDNRSSPEAGKAHTLPYPIQLQACWTAYVLPDLHFGLLAHRKETGESFDLDIADREYREAFQQLLAATPDTPHATVLFLGDFFHTNTQLPLTPRSSHLLDVDGRWRKGRVLWVAIRLLRP